MMHRENQQKRRARCAKDVTAAEGAGVRENHPPLARMNLAAKIFRRVIQAHTRIAPKSPSKISDDPEPCRQGGCRSNFCAEVQGKIRFAVVFCRGEMAVGERRRQHG